VKQWDAHLLTKQHRTSVSREKASQAKLAAKRSAPDQSAEGSSKRAKTAGAAEPAEETPMGLPAGFFSAGNQPQVADEDDEEGSVSQSNVAGAGAGVAGKVESTGDQELDDFFASLDEDTPAAVDPPPVNLAEGKKKGYQSSSSAAIQGVASYESAPVLLQTGTEQTEQAEEAGQPVVEETEEEKRTRIAREEKEEIMGRLEEEERAQ
jgi:zinc finger protein 830